MKEQVIRTTGALADIGRATALTAENDDYWSVVSGRNSQTDKALESELRALGSEARIIINVNGGRTAS